ncbi:DUF1778 domain-containing protein [Escherichia coli]|uniref:type II toxin -antitoxin system TacA 1-like antitoxin n=1 Tax=Escherichia coli TaxID=562 RepID=UPI0013D34543|nr:DUF1778 domain-containing protein [Escherichia coli]MDY9503176.1 DUF1778 domain-containing protein [Escherichia coli]NGK52339.1 DUF1778 domain-containing protein [Escherichia coli]HBD5441600.1 DUF1778 domain-containing protein [Escherichia coli]HCQ3817655.1 DUF1778 domain-containing protein [Escherichia coli]HEB2125781.1 DUF1778 domain-containing protein [Escherichia coli]
MDEERDPVIQEAADILGIEYNDFLYKTAVRESQWFITNNPGIFNQLTDEEFDRALDIIENHVFPPINAPSLEEIYARIDARNEELKKEKQ